MIDDVVLNKVTTIERCIIRVREEYAAAGEHFATDYSRQDAAIFNIQRACEAALDLGHHLRRDKLGLPQSARNVFDLLAQAGRIGLPLAESLKKWWIFAISRFTITRPCFADYRQCHHRASG